MRTFIMIFLSFISVISWCQNPDTNRMTNTFAQVNQSQYKIAKNSMLGLTAFATVNMIGGLIGREYSSGTTKYFHEMNFGFNTVNFLLGGIGYLTLKRPSEVSFTATLASQHKYEKIYLFNAGLDLAYAMGGVALKQYARQQKPEEFQRFEGYGNSIILQAGCLFVYDLILYHLHHKNTQKIMKGLNHLSLTFTGNGLGLCLRI